MRLKRIDYRHFLCIGITLGFLACTVFAFPNAIGRLIESIRDIALSLAYYVCEIFDIEHSIDPLVNSLPKYPFFDFMLPLPAPPPSTVLPETSVGFAEVWRKYWGLFGSSDTFIAYLSFLMDSVMILMRLLLILAVFVLLVKILFKRYMNSTNNLYNVDTLPLKIWKRLSALVLPVKRWVIGFIDFIKDQRYYYLLWAVIWLINFNVITICFEAIAYVIYLSASFDVIHIYRQFYKLALDVAPLFRHWYILVAVALIVFDKFRKNIGYSRLRHYEMRNRGFINERPIVFFAVGSMGTGKTKFMTDVGLSLECMLRDKAYELLLECDMKFPNFPWQEFENALKRAIGKHSVYNLATCRRFVWSKQKKFERKPYRKYCFSYDFKRYGMTYDNALYVADLWQVLEDYAQLYFIYTIQCSMIVSNYAVRVDNLMSDMGNFSLWNNDFFSRDSRLLDSFSRHSKIFDFDMLRLGKKVLEKNINKDVLEFGVFLITEHGKERGNSLETKELKRVCEYANQKNDLYNYGIKMIRHPGTVCGYPFVKYIGDEQRAQSLGADIRELGDVAKIIGNDDKRLAMPFFWLEDWVHDAIARRFLPLYKNYRFTHGNNTLLVYLLKNIYAKVHRYFVRVENTFDYAVMHFDVSDGSLSEKGDRKKYYIMSKKIYSKRYSTDCYREFFTDKRLASPRGLMDLPEFTTEKATKDELSQENSYFIDDLLNLGDSDDERYQ